MIEEQEGYCPDPDSAYEEQFEIEEEPEFGFEEEMGTCIRCGEKTYLDQLNEVEECPNCAEREYNETEDF